MKTVPKRAHLILSWLPAWFGLKFVISTSFEEPDHELAKENCGTSQQQQGSEFQESKSQLLAREIVLNFSAIHFIHTDTLSFYLQSLFHIIYLWALLVNGCVTRRVEEAQLRNLQIRRIAEAGSSWLQSLSFSFQTVLFFLHTLPWMEISQSIWWHPSLTPCKKSEERQCCERKFSPFRWKMDRWLSSSATKSLHLKMLEPSTVLLVMPL